MLMVHRARTLTMANRVAQVNQIRGLLGEFGVVVPKGAGRLRRELPGILEDAENGLPVLAREVLCGLLEQLREANMRISAYDRQIRALAEASEPARRLMQIESIGPQTATALVRGEAVSYQVLSRTQALDGNQQAFFQLVEHPVCTVLRKSKAAAQNSRNDDSPYPCSD